MRARHLAVGFGVLGWVACAPRGAVRAPEPVAVRPGIEVLLADSLHLVRGRRVALLTNHTGVDRAGRRDVDLLLAAGVAVTTLFTPEHGFRGTEDRPDLANTLDGATGLPIYSVYGATRTPDVSALDSIDVLLIDLQDVGARYYTYPSTAVLMMRDAARRGVRVVILDRPNPVGGTAVQGTMPAPPGELPASGGFLPVPMRHGMTIGELARYANVELGVGADLVVVPAAGWRRRLYYDGVAGLPWVRPSPAMPGLESALHYPGTCLFEGTNLSVGRGTDVPFQVVGAPWLEPGRVLRALGVGEGGRGTGAGLDGVAVTATTFTPHDPTDAKYGGTEVRGLRLRVTDRSRYDPTRAAVALLAAIRAAHPDSFRFREGRFERLAGDERLRGGLESGARPAEIWREWAARLAWFMERRAKYLVY
jgi:uncharacterized protein YbbC (DUF1343 family)